MDVIRALLLALMPISLTDSVVVIPNTTTGAGAYCASIASIGTVIPVGWSAVSGKPAFGTASLAASSDFATAAQGAKADSAVQSAGLTKAAVGLGNCDNTSDAAKPVSTAQQTALNAKANAPTVAAAPATTGAMTIPMIAGVITITPTGNCTFNASGGAIGQIVTFAITTVGTTSRTLTFGTNFRKAGTLATGTTAARFFSVSFVCIDGTIWQEIARTAVQT